MMFEDSETEKVLAMSDEDLAEYYLREVRLPRKPKQRQQVVDLLRSLLCKMGVGRAREHRLQVLARITEDLPFKLSLKAAGRTVYFEDRHEIRVPMIRGTNRRRLAPARRPAAARIKPKLKPGALRARATLREETT